MDCHGGIFYVYGKKGEFFKNVATYGGGNALRIYRKVFIAAFCFYFKTRNIFMLAGFCEYFTGGVKYDGQRAVGEF